MIENKLKRFDIFEAELDGETAGYYLVIDGEKSLRKGLPIISIPVVKEKLPGKALYIDCTINSETYMAVIDGVVPVPRENMTSQEPVGHLAEGKERDNIEATFKLLLNM